MRKINCTVFDKKSNKLKNVGFMEIKNSSNGNGELYLYGDIVSDQWGKWSDDDTCPQDVANFLKELNSFDNLDIYINSGGGSVFAGIAIYHQLKRHNGFKTVHIDGIAASITSVISCAGDKVIIPKSAQFMIHKPTASYFWTSLNADELRKEADTLDICQDSIRNIYMENVKEGITEEEINNLINAETWFTGETVTDYFNFEVEESSEKVASTSQFYDKYKNTPNKLLKNKIIKNNEHNELKNKLQTELDLLSV
ncbi:Clp protease ClpP [Clostridium botulinum]|uniref:head maturation protease, ClpP-related n=1 Tax=Clostridium botulinum TaxID=1491 RepID=UPI0013F10FD6|nr:head maturation protease, ClpP-related [Clostridium botulinum]MBY6898001.1 Clp protease ClpP [Clostridium botulinum]MBY6912314.1 Clp protease ClpP [Clostridium botulinum]MCR1176416.1 Clp protease ClpP [Clostridium botulinum]NEZ80621.1 Clp protease ClpP [Clostridium botulinum]NFA18147.1 Clp protease ClpP [Clostridium botulinum]